MPQKHNICTTFNRFGSIIDLVDKDLGSKVICVPVLNMNHMSG